MSVQSSIEIHPTVVQIFQFDSKWKLNDLFCEVSVGGALFSSVQLPSRIQTSRDFPRDQIPTGSRWQEDERLYFHI